MFPKTFRDNFVETFVGLAEGGQGINPPLVSFGALRGVHPVVQR